MGTACSIEHTGESTPLATPIDSISSPSHDFSAELAQLRLALTEVRLKNRELERNVKSTSDLLSVVPAPKVYPFPIETRNNFDDLIERAQIVFNVPTAVITLLHKNQLYLLSEPVEVGSENMSYYTQTTSKSKTIVIKDTEMEATVPFNPLAKKRGKTRFYAGTPIFSHDGLAIGTFSLLDTKPRADWEHDDTTELMALAQKAGSFIYKSANLDHMIPDSAMYEKKKPTKRIQSINPT
jgi:hypothetical protein